MIWVATVVSLVLGSLWVAQAALVWGYARRLRDAGPQPAERSQCPMATVVLCVRGNDPSLEHAVSAVLQQDYPNYRVLFVFDHASDPGFSVVKRLMRRFRECDSRTLVLPVASGESSLKCDAVVHAMRSLGHSCEIVALIDADTLVHRTWLRELVAPFRDPQVGATTGLRWYEPPAAELGAVVRAIWNTAAIVQMYWYHVAWGGSLAIRREVLQQTKLLELWSRAFCEDTLVSNELARHGYRLSMVPALHMVNFERCDLGGFFHWVTRQLLTTRLYHQHWRLIAGHGLGTSATLCAMLILLMLAVLTQQATVLLLLLGTLVLYELGSLGLLYLIRRTARAILSRAGRPLPRWKAETAILYSLALPVTQALYGLATVRSLLTRRVTWRGLEYEIGRRGSIRLKKYAPYRQANETLRADHSL